MFCGLFVQKLSLFDSLWVFLLTMTENDGRVTDFSYEK